MEELFETLNLKEKLLMIIFEKYTYKIYNHGIKVGFNYCNSQGCNKAVTSRTIKHKSAYFNRLS